MQALRECKTDLTIIIPVYNLEEHIQPMLTSLKHQELNEYKVEVIFVLNNCTDDSEKIIKANMPDARILYCFIQGCGSARNVGMDAATGEFIWFMDGDDWLLSDTAIKDVLDKAYGEDLNILWIPFASDRYQYQYFSMVWQYLFRRSFVDEFRFPDIQPAEDDAFTAWVLRKAGRNQGNYMWLPRMEKPQYFYNYMREGSNMFRYNRGEKI